DVAAMIKGLQNHDAALVKAAADGFHANAMDVSGNNVPLNGGTYNPDGTTVADALSTATGPLPPAPVSPLTPAAPAAPAPLPAAAPAVDAPAAAAPATPQAAAAAVAAADTAPAAADHSAADHSAADASTELPHQLVDPSMHHLWA